MARNILFIVLLTVLLSAVFIVLSLWCLHLPNHAGLLLAYADCQKHFHHLRFESMLQMPEKSAQIQHQDSFNPTLFRLSQNVVCLQRSRTYMPGWPLMNSQSHDLVKTTFPFAQLTTNKRKGANLKQEVRLSVDGCHDARFVAISDNRIFLLGSHKLDRWIGREQVWKHVLVELNITASKVERMSFVEIPKTLGVRNKNWTVFEHNGQWLVHTHSAPQLRLFLLEHAKGTNLAAAQNDWKIMREVACVDTHDFFKNLRVGPNPVQHVRGTSNWLRTKENTYLTILHFAQEHPNPFPGGCLGRIYRSVFVEFDANSFEPVARTDGLCFGQKCQNVQFASSIMWIDEERKDKLAIGFGVMDKESWVGVVRLSTIRLHYTKR
jgi:hypothetical protein